MDHEAPETPPAMPSEPPPRQQPPLKQAPPPPQKKPRALGCTAILLGMMGFFLFGSMLVNFVLLAVLGSQDTAHVTSDSDGGIEEFPVFSETVTYGQGSDKVAHIKVDGPIMRTAENGFFAPAQYDKVQQVLRRIRAANNDSKVKGILLEVNSPGGAITPSDEIYHALKTYKEADSNRVVVVFMRDLAASGGYYVSMASDWIIAEPTTIVGSIGVIMQALNVSELSDKVGITSTTIASGENKDLLNPFNPVDTNHIGMMQVMIDEMYDQFLTIVSEGREIDKEVLRPLCDGRIFTPTQAVENDLIDEIGYFESAISKTAELLGKKSVKLIKYDERPMGFWEVFTGSPAVKSPIVDLETMLRKSTTPRMMYMWTP